MDGDDVGVVQVAGDLSFPEEALLDRLSSDVLVIKPQGYISPVTFKPGPNGVVYAD